MGHPQLNGDEKYSVAICLMLTIKKSQIDWTNRAVTIIAEFDEARAEKLKKNQTPTTQIFFNFSQNVDNRQRK